MLERVFKIHQALHGYSDGHRLIKASRNLPADVERTMLVLSDMSGASMVQGFENYVTGYPINEIKSYVLARTWYAPEMKRPGCVWTHSLLIENSALAHIFDVTRLLQLFERPTADRLTWERYESCLEIILNREIQNEDEPARKTFWLDLACTLLFSTYSYPNQQIYIQADKTGADHEDVILSLWNQQWAKLRRSFSFCTGSISDRKLPDRAFDVQIIPRSSMRDISLTVKSGIFIEREKLEDVAFPEWHSTAVADLLEINSDLRSFLSIFGAETQRGRADFIPLIELFLSVREDAYSDPSELKTLIELIADLFPAPTAGSQMKASFLGGAVSKRGQIPSFLNKASEAAVLSELTKTDCFKSFDPTTLMISSRAADLLEYDPQTTITILRSIFDSTRLTPIGEQFLNGIFERLSGIESYRFSDHEFEILLLLLQRYRSLAATPNVWRTTPMQQRAIFEALTKHNALVDSEVAGIVHAMLDAKSDAVATDLGWNFPESTALAILQWCQVGTIESVTSVSAKWLNVVSENGRLSINSAMDYKEVSLSLLLLLALSLDPNSRIVREKGSNLWVEFTKKIPEKLQENFRGKVMSFVLAVGFSNIDQEGRVLVENSFGIVHKAAEQHWLSETDWIFLRSHAPTAYSIPRWDKCGRLRNALIEQFMKNRWPYQSLLDCLDDPELLQKVVSQVVGRGPLFNSQKGYLEKIAKQAVAGHLKANPKQKNILKTLT